MMKLNRKSLVRYEAEKLDPRNYKISARTRLVGYRIQRFHPPEQRAQPKIISSTTRPIIIQYGHPVSTKRMKKTHAKADEKKEVVQNAEKLRSFNQRVVVVKGRLQKPITNMRRRAFHTNFNTLML